MDSIFEILMGLPLFNGVSAERISEIAGKTKLHFLKYQPGETITSKGEICTHIKFILSGKVRLTITNADDRFKLSQSLNAPDVIFPEFLFGKVTEYPCDVVAEDLTGILQISKSDYMQILKTDEIFLFNILNYLSFNAQKSVDGVLSLSSGALEQRIAFWIEALTQRNSTDIVLSCRQRDLYSLFGVQRNMLITALDNLKSAGILDYSQSEIKVKSRRDLLNVLEI